MASGGVLLEDIELGFTDNRASYLPVMAGLNLSIGPTEFVAIVGPSGCGKSTLLRAISGLQPVQRGDIRWPQAQTPRDRQRSALVFQSPRLLPWRTVRQNVAYGLEALGVAKPEAARRSLELLSTVGLSDFADAYPRQ